MADMGCDYFVKPTEESYENLILHHRRYCLSPKAHLPYLLLARTLPNVHFANVLLALLTGANDTSNPDASPQGTLTLPSPGLSFLPLCLLSNISTGINAVMLRFNV